METSRKDDAAETRAQQAVAQERERRWREANREAIDSANAYVERHGLPLAHHRMF